MLTGGADAAVSRAPPAVGAGDSFVLPRRADVAPFRAPPAVADVEVVPEDVMDVDLKPGRPAA